MSAESLPAESDWQFVDTNILVYAYDRSAGVRHETASSLWTEDLNHGQRYGHERNGTRALNPFA